MSGDKTNQDSFQTVFNVVLSLIELGKLFGTVPKMTVRILLPL